MSLANKVFRNNKTGETVKVIDSFENIAILENKEKIDVKNLMDTSQYTEQIDPNTFFNNQGAYNALADKIKNIPTDGLVDESVAQQIGQNQDGMAPTTNESAVVMTTEEDEMAELARKYGVDVDNSDAVAQQNDAFDKILNPEKHQPSNNENVQQVQVQRDEVPAAPVQRVNVEDPIITMFRKTKRNVKFDVNLEISDKIPRLDFIEMMEDSYEISMIDFLADEFTNKILNDPTVIREKIKDKIKQLVYGIAKSERVDQEEVKENAPTKKNEEVKETPKKLSASDRAKNIMTLETVEEVELALKGEKAKSVKEAGEKRIAELKK